MVNFKNLAALLLSVAALLTSVLALTAAQKKEEMQKATVKVATDVIAAAQNDVPAASSLDSDACEVQLLGVQVQNMEVVTMDATVNTLGPLQAIEAKLHPVTEKKEEDPAKKYADDNNYPDFCGRLYVPSAGIDVALYNNTAQETCNRSDSAAIFPHRPEAGGSNIVADNELESLPSVAVGSTAYVITPDGQQINYVCVDAFNGHNGVIGFDELQKEDGTIVWGSAELIVYTCIGDSYNVRVACFNRT